MTPNTSTLSRRDLMRSGTLLIVLGTDACVGTSVAAFSAQALADVTGISNATSTIISALDEEKPGAIPTATETQIANWSSVISEALGTLSLTTPASSGVGTLGTIDANLSSILTVVGPILNDAASVIPELLPIVTIYDGVVSLLPTLETYVNSVITTVSPTTTAARKPLAIPAPLLKTVTPEQARSLLHIATVAAK